MAKPKLRIVFQGGGARVATLLAAADALESMGDQYAVDRVIGTSAGAIAACVFSSPAPVAHHVARIKDEGKKIIDRFTLPPAMPVLGRPRLYAKIAGGGAVFDEALVKSFFDDVFIDKGGAKIDRLSKLSYPTELIASNIQNREKVVYRASTERDLSTCLMDSCAFPLAFRNSKQNDMIVDGGLCANLPVDDVFLVNDDTHLLVFAFEKAGPDREKPANVVEFAKALFSTAVDASVDSAVARAEDHGGYVIKLPNDFDTFEFEKALTEGLVDDGSSVFSKTRDFAASKIRDALDSFRRNKIRAGRTVENRLISQKLLNIAGSHISSAASDVLEDTCIVFADSLRGDAGRSDRVVQLYALDPKASETRVLKIPVHEAIGVNSEFNTLRVTDRHGQEAEFEEIVVTEPVAPGDSRVRHYVLAFFTQPIGADKGPLKVSYSVEIGDICTDLVSKGYTWLRFYNQRASAIAVNNNILLVPTSYVSQLNVCDMPDRKQRYANDKDLGDFDRDNANWCKGEALDASALAQLIAETFPNNPDINQYNAYGWRAENVLPAHRCGAFFERLPG